MSATSQSDSTKARAKADTAKHLSALANSPSFPAFKQIIEADVEQKLDRFLRTETLTDQQLDYSRGWVAGLRYAVSVIEDGEREFQKAMEVVQRIEEAEQ